MSPIAVILHCLKAGASRFHASRLTRFSGARSSSHTQICPPDAMADTNPGGLFGTGLLKSRRDPLNELFALREEFLEVLEDVEHADYLRSRIERAKSSRELWHLRASVFNHVAQQHSQREAAKRLAQLNRHFPKRSSHDRFLAPLLNWLH